MSPLASLSRSIEDGSRVRRVAPTSSSSCRMFVALAIGAVILGPAISQARATCACVASCWAATSSSARRMRWPRSFRVLTHARPARTLPEIRFRPVLSSQESIGQRIIADHADPLLTAKRLKFLFVGSPLVKIVFGLQTLIPRQPRAGAHVKRLFQPGSAVV